MSSAGSRYQGSMCQEVCLQTISHKVYMRQWENTPLVQRVGDRCIGYPQREGTVAGNIFWASPRPSNFFPTRLSERTDIYQALERIYYL